MAYTVTRHIDVGDHLPISLKPYKTPLNKMKYMTGAIKEMASAGFIERSHSPWSFPLVIIDKKIRTLSFHSILSILGNKKK